MLKFDTVRDAFRPSSRSGAVAKVDRARRSRRRARGFAAALLAAGAAATLHAEPTAGIADAQGAVAVGRYRLQSNPWVNLHQRLLYEARFGESPPAALADADLARWKAAVESYRAFLGMRSPIVDAELKSLNAALSATSSATLPDTIPKTARDALEKSMPLYRAQWETDDRANRFWISVAEPLLASAGEELAEAHTKAYGVAFPTHIRVDVCSFGWEFGSYTVGEGDSAHVVIASTVAGNQGFASLEMLMHEPSHAIVAPASGAIGADLARISAELGIRPDSYLWHAILFYTSGELTRRALASRGVPDYRPVILGMYERGFRDFRQALETHWQAYLDGKLTRDAAIRKILIETAPPKKKR
jgi:hypothetical protein